MKRHESIAALTNAGDWDVIVIGGGASGLGAALDAATRGFRTLLLESHDFAKGTSSRSTKLVHGGVRYLAQGNIGLIREALYERGLLAKNAAHLFINQSFIVPNYRWWEGPYYRLGFSIYDALAGKLGLGRSRYLSVEKTLSRLPTVNQAGLKGAVVYQDGQFDDARLAISLAQTITEQGGVVLNHMRVVDFIRDESTGRLCGVIARDELGANGASSRDSGKTHTLRAKVIVNATGVFTNAILAMSDPAQGRLVVPSQGVHLVLDHSFLASCDALMIPKTSDGRVLFVIPWHGCAVIGTTDTQVAEVSEEPRALESEIEFLLNTAGAYLAKKPTRRDVRCVFAGLRPLAAPKDGEKRTKEISRSHKILVSEAGLVSLIGGKWTTYRRMAEEVIDKAIKVGGLPRAACKTKSLAIHGNLPPVPPAQVDRANPLSHYGSDSPAIRALQASSPEFAMRLHPAHPFTIAEVVWAIRNEMAETIEDVLARRVGILWRDARAAIEAAPRVAEVFVCERAWTAAQAESQVAAFTALARGYLLDPEI